MIGASWNFSSWAAAGQELLKNMALLTSSAMITIIPSALLSITIIALLRYIYWRTQKGSGRYIYLAVPLPSFCLLALHKSTL